MSFNEAESVFYDEFARVISDPDNSIGEARFVILGKTEQHNTLVVCHCYQDSEDKIRIISARKAEKRERKQYEDYRYA